MAVAWHVTRRVLVGTRREWDAGLAIPTGCHPCSLYGRRRHEVAGGTSRPPSPHIRHPHPRPTRDSDPEAHPPPRVNGRSSAPGSRPHTRGSAQRQRHALPDRGRSSTAPQHSPRYRRRGRHDEQIVRRTDIRLGCVQTSVGDMPIGMPSVHAYTRQGGWRRTRQYRGVPSNKPVLRDADTGIEKATNPQPDSASRGLLEAIYPRRSRPCMTCNAMRTRFCDRISELRGLSMLNRGVGAWEVQRFATLGNPAHQPGRCASLAAHLHDLTSPLADSDVTAANNDPVSDGCLHNSPPRFRVVQLLVYARRVLCASGSPSSSQNYVRENVGERHVKTRTPSRGRARSHQWSRCWHAQCEKSPCCTAPQRPTSLLAAPPCAR